MNRLLIATGALAMSLALAGCSDNGSSLSTSDDDDDNGTDNGSQDMDSTVDFTDFVISEIGNTTEGRDAVAINDLEFRFEDQDNEQAFDELF